MDHEFLPIDDPVDNSHAAHSFDGDTHQIVHREFSLCIEIIRTFTLFLLICHVIIASATTSLMLDIYNSDRTPALHFLTSTLHVFII
jgi:hypothetical protein